MIAKIYPRMENEDLSKNDDLLTSTMYKVIQLVDVLKEKLNIESIILDTNKSDYDIVISRFMAEEINSFDKSKPVFEFYYDGLNGGWFFERYSFNDIQFVLSNGDDNKLIELAGDIFFNPEVKSSIGVNDL